MIALPTASAGVVPRPNAKLFEPRAMAMQPDDVVKIWCVQQSGIPPRATQSSTAAVAASFSEERPFARPTFPVRAQNEIPEDAAQASPAIGKQRAQIIR